MGGLESGGNRSRRHCLTILWHPSILWNGCARKARRELTCSRFSRGNRSNFRFPDPAHENPLSVGNDGVGPRASQSFVSSLGWLFRARAWAWTQPRPLPHKGNFHGSGSLNWWSAGTPHAKSAGIRCTLCVLNAPRQLYIQDLASQMLFLPPRVTGRLRTATAWRSALWRSKANSSWRPPIQACQQRAGATGGWPSISSA